MTGLGRFAAIIAVAALLTGCQRGVDARRIEQTKAGEWLTYGRTYDEQRFSPLKQIDAQTIGKAQVEAFGAARAYPGSRTGRRSLPQGSSGCGDLKRPYR